jgi:hypothetical protein
MRSVLVLCFLAAAACTSAASAHSKPRHHHVYNSGAYNSFASYGGGYPSIAGGTGGIPNFSYDTEASHSSSQWGGQPD